MSTEQRDVIEAGLRAVPKGLDGTVEQERDGFARFAAARPVPDDVVVTERTLGGRPALVSAIRGARADGVLLYLHGGGYVVGSAGTGLGLAAELARRSGTRAVSLDYRLAPEHPFPAAVEDAVAAYRELLAEGAEPGQIVIAGDSAGGALAVALLVAAERAGLPRPAAAVTFSAWADLTGSGASMTSKAEADPLFTAAKIGWYADHYRPSGDRRDPLASPVFADLTGLPPLLVQVGEHEILLDDSVRLAARAAAAGVDVRLEVSAGMPHVFQLYFAELEEADAALARAAAFVAEHLAAVPAAP